MRPNCFFLISSIKLGRFLWNLVHSFLYKFATKSVNVFSPHLNNVSTLPCETLLLKCSSRTCYHWVVRERNCRIYSTLTVATKFDRFESSWLQSVGHIVKEGVQNTHHWCGRTETASENEVAQLDRVIIAAAIRQWRRR